MQDKPNDAGDDASDGGALMCFVTLFIASVLTLGISILVVLLAALTLVAKGCQ